jgi:hypothetical protein
VSKLSLDPDARERYGVGEWLEYDTSKLAAREMATIQLESRARLGGEGYNTPGAWLAALRRNEPEAMIALVWTALRRNGVDVAYADVDFEILGLRFESDTPPSTADGEESEPGKDDASGDEPTTT